MNILRSLPSRVSRLISDILSDSNCESCQLLSLLVPYNHSGLFLVGDGLGSTSLESHCWPQNRFKILNTLYTPKLKDGVGTISGVRKQMMQPPTSARVIVQVFQLKLWIYRWLNEKNYVRFGAQDFLNANFIFQTRDHEQFCLVASKC